MPEDPERAGFSGSFLFAGRSLMRSAFWSTRHLALLHLLHLLGVAFFHLLGLLLMALFYLLLPLLREVWLLHALIFPLLTLLELLVLLILLLRQLLLLVLILAIDLLVAGVCRSGGGVLRHLSRMCIDRMIFRSTGR